MDLNDVIDSFFLESQEGLDLMERSLLKLRPGHADSESINEVFRAAHSIKGGGGIFGFSEISDFMHGVETLLDQLRNGSRTVTSEICQLLLEAVDCTRHMFETARTKQPQDSERVESLSQRIESMLYTADTADNSIADSITATNAHSDKRQHAQWNVHFTPHPGMLAKANDPLRMIRELSELGDLQPQVDISRLPDFDLLDPAECYLGWDIKLQGPTDQNSIEEIFAWVTDECDLHISSPDAEPLATIPAQETVSAPVAVSSPKIDTTAILDAIVPPVRAVEPQPAQKQSAAAITDSIRVSIDKIDDLINLVGELVITQSMLSRFDNDTDQPDMDQLRSGLSQLMRNTRDLQESVLQIRMLPISFCFNRFPRLVHDISNKLNKKVQLRLIGEDTELDKTVLERINDPLVHLVRNALDHGLETPEQRKAANKSEIGTLEIRAFHESGNIVIEVTDDGAGLNTRKIRATAISKGLISEEEPLTDTQINNLIFQAGFSTADKVSDLSGRGVGMDVVKRNINELGGDVWLESTHGQGTRIMIRLPLTLAILDGQLLRVGKEIYIMPLMSIIETLQVDARKVNVLPGGTLLYRLRDLHIPIIQLSDTFGVNASARRLQDGLLVVVDSERHQYGIWVDELLDQQQVVIKSLESNFKHVQGVSGATILGNGTVSLILDVNGIIEQSGQRHAARSVA